jgi:type IV secretory pathway VirB6-like protein
VINLDLKKIIFKFLLIYILIIPNAFADRNIGIERIRGCSATDGSVNPFDPMYISNSSGVTIGREIEYSLKDPVCMIQFLTLYAKVKASIAMINKICNNDPSMPSPFPNIFKDMSALAKATNKARTDRNCLLTLTGLTATTIASTFQVMGIIYETAKGEFNRVRICGSNWLGPDKDKYIFNDKSGYLHDLYTKNNERKFDKSEKQYRELLYGGIEFEDRISGDDTCMDPTTNTPQKYYLRGTRQGNFLCDRYNPKFTQNDQRYQKAFECCKKRRREFICLEKSSSSNEADWNRSDYIFCQADSKCVFKNNIAVTYETFKRDNGRLICAKSSSVCPFNFSVGGGTIYPDYYKDGSFEGNVFKPFKPSKTTEGKCDKYSDVRDSDCKFNEKAGKLKNFCQYYTHCTIVEPYSKEVDFNNLNAYFSKACIDFVGDSQNGKNNSGISSNIGIGIDSQRQFSAPIVQCLKETMYNIFQNIYGHSKCQDGSYGDDSNICVNSLNQPNYQINQLGTQYKVGNKVMENSFFEIVQGNLKNIITLVLVLSMSFFGYKLIMAKVDLENRKEILTYIIKIAFVIYFVNGDAWKSIFFDGIYNGSNQISQIFFKVKTGSKTDKCNFGSMYDNNGVSIYTSARYPAGKEYLMIWDTLDCKIMEYLNYGPGFSSSTLFSMIIAGFFTGGIGLMVGLSVFILAIFMISAVVRAMHIFISSAIGIIIYVFMSPIIIPLILFERTKGIFDAWLSHLMSFTLQPIILFSYIAIFVTLTDQIFYGDFAREGNDLDCRKYCINTVSYAKEYDASKCTGGTMSDIVDPKNSVAACIVRFDEYGSNNSFAFLGVTLSTLTDIITQDPEIKIMILLKTALFLYLLSQFMDEIPGISSRLIGENIDVKTGNLFEYMKKLQGNIRSVQKRATRFTKIQGKSKVDSLRGKASESQDGGKKGGEGGGESKDSVGGSSGDSGGGSSDNVSGGG